MADPMMPPAAMGGGPVWDPLAQKYQDTITTRDPTHTDTSGVEAGQLAPQTQAATEQTISDQGNLQTVKAQGMDAAKAMDQAEQAKAQALQADAITQQQAQQAAAAKYEALMQEAQADLKEKAARYAEAAQPEVQSFGSKIASAIGMALGAYAATRAGTPNYAAQIVQMMADAAQKEHESRLAAALHLYERSGANGAQILAARKGAMDELEAGRIARARAIETQYQAAIAKNPQHAQKLQEELATAKLAEDKDTRNFLAQHLEQKIHDAHTQEGQIRTVSSVNGQGGVSGQRLPSTNDIEELSIAEELNKKATRLDELTKNGQVPTPKQIDAFQNRTNSMVASQIKESHGQGAILMGALGRALDALPNDAYAGMSPGQREWMKLHTEMVHQVGVKKFGQSAMSNPESYHEFIAPLMYSRGNTLEEGIEKGRAMSDQMHTTWRNISELTKGGVRQQALESQPVQPSSGQTAYSRDTTKALVVDVAKKMTSKDARAKLDADDLKGYQWLIKNQGNPRAAEVAAKLAAKLSGGAL